MIISKRPRHILYGLFVAVIFIPYCLTALGTIAYERLDGIVMRTRRWCYRENYIPHARKPGEL